MKLTDAKTGKEITVLDALAMVEDLKHEIKWRKEVYSKLDEINIELNCEVQRLRKQLEKMREQRNIYHTICDENDLVNYHRHIKALDAEIETIE